MLRIIVVALIVVFAGSLLEAKMSKVQISRCQSTCKNKRHQCEKTAGKNKQKVYECAVKFDQCYKNCK